MAGLTKKGEVYYATFRVNGKTKWKRIGKVSFRDAKEYLKKLESKSDRDKLGLIDLTPIKFDQFSVQYLAHSRANKALETWKSDNWSVRALSRHFGSMLLDAIDNGHIELYKAERQRHKGLQSDNQYRASMPIKYAQESSRCSASIFLAENKEAHCTKETAPFCNAL